MSLGHLNWVEQYSKVLKRLRVIQKQPLDQLLLLGFGQKWPHYVQNRGSFSVKMTQMYVYFMKNGNLIVI